MTEEQQEICHIVPIFGEIVASKLTTSMLVSAGWALAAELEKKAQAKIDDL